MQGKYFKHSFLKFLKDRFDLEEDKANEQEVIDNIKRSVEFKGTNLWILIFAIFIASVGLNVNSTAVIIGAMLVSPLMGPIMGFGLSLGIYDFELMKRSLRNFSFAVVISLITSTLYFAISPLSLAQSELLARTTPTTWDVLIAFFGGLAGIVAQSRRDRTSTVIPGVAIATALMPPLCTAGYGLGTMQFQYFFGAAYLFFINAVFISLATFMIVRFMKYQKKQFVDRTLEKRVRNYMFITIVITIVPSVMLAYNIVDRTVFETNVQKYVTKSFNFDETQVLDFKGYYSSKDKSIEVMLVGKRLSDDAIVLLNNQLPEYNLHSVKLILRQPADANNEGGVSVGSIDKLYSVSNKLLEEKDKSIERLQQLVDKYYRDTLPTYEISKEFSALAGIPVQFAISKMAVYQPGAETPDSILVCIVKSYGNGMTLDSKQKEQITSWLKVRAKAKDIRLIYE